MSTRNGYFSRLNEIADLIDPMQPNADWGREFGRAVFETSDEDLIVYVLSDAGEKYWSGRGTKLRSRARKAARVLTKSTNGERAIAMQKVLEFSVTVTGMPQMSLGQACHLIMVDACAEKRRSVDGDLQNLELMEHVRDISAPWPTDSFQLLIERGDLSSADFSGFERFA